MNLKGKKILVTGGAGFLGSYVIKELERRGVPRSYISVAHSKEFDLRRPEDCRRAVRGQHVVIHLAAKVGGIGFNRLKPGELFYDNIIMSLYILEAARETGVEKFVSVGTICAYPKYTPAPFKEEHLWHGYPEETNAPYGLAKKALLTQTKAYRDEFGMSAVYLLPVNLYGPGDSFDHVRSHVIPALIRKVVEAKRAKQDYIDVWGTGSATREFLFVEDAARAVVLATERYEKPHPINLGSGHEIAIKDLVNLICRLAEFKGEVRWDTTKPDGQPRRLLDVTKAEQEFGFRAETKFEEGLRRTIEWYEKAITALPPRTA